MKRIITFLFFLAALQTIAQQNIIDVRKLAKGEPATLSGIITNGNELGTIRYVQDTSAGIAIYDSQLDGVKRGDSITVSGEIDIYNNLMEIKNVTSLTVHSSGNQLPAPKVLTIGEIGEDYEGQLIEIKDIEFENANGTFSGNKNYNFTNDQETGVIRIGNGSPIIGQIIPGDKIDLVAICSQFSYKADDTETGYQLIPRTMDDFISGSPINFTSPPTISNISETGFTISWSTDLDASSEIIYGEENNPALWTTFATGSSTPVNEEFFHEVEITGLNPATIIFAKAFSVLNTDTTFSTVSAFASRSNSTGEIKAYFNTPVNTGLATETDAQYIAKAMEDTLIAYIGRAVKTIDFCIYNINNSGLSNVSTALNTAHNRGVRVRFITCGATAHSGVDDLMAGIPVIESPVFQNSGIMHNKFVVFDAQSTDATKSWVWSGSTNLTYDQVNTDANNSIYIQDQSLAKAYQIEFEEMWGSTGDDPDQSEAKFGASKTNNTPHEFIIGGNRVQLYFSPSDGTNQQIINAINTADNDLNVETMLITRSDLAYAISNAKQRGVEVHVVTDNSNSNTETVNNILNEALPGAKFIFDNSAKGILHHKLAIVDANFAASDPQVITGSHNWSSSANNKNDENTLIIHNADIANQYFQQFAYRFAENGGDLAVSTENIEFENVKVYPNPTVGKVMVSSQIPIKNIIVFELNGKVVQKINMANPFENEVSLNSYKTGIYILKVQTIDSKSNTYKIIKK